MQARTVTFLLGFAFLGTFTFADIPPPPETGPVAIDMAGLKFVRQQLRASPNAPPPGHYIGRKNYIFLTDCETAQPNCTLARHRNVVGFVVSAINGRTVRTDLGEFERAYEATPKGRKVVLTMVSPADAPAAYGINVDECWPLTARCNNYKPAPLKPPHTIKVAFNRD